MKNIVLILACFFVFAHVHAADDSPHALKKVTFLLNRLSDDFFFQEMFAGLTQLQNEGLVEEVERVSYNSDAQQLRQKFDAALVQSDAIIMNYTDATQVDYFVSRAKQQNTPIVFIFTRPTVQALTDNAHIFYITQDNVQSGVNQGLLFSRYLATHPQTDKNHDGIINLLNIAGSGYSAPDEQERFVWLLNTINNYPGNTLKAKEIENFPAYYGYQPAYDHIIELANSGALNSIEFIIVQSDKMTQGVVAALIDSGHTDIPVIARGGAPEMKQLVMEQKLVGTVHSQPRQLTYYAGKMAYNYANQREINENIPYRIYKGAIELPYQIVTAHNL